MTKVSVVIPNYNGEKFLRDCLNSLNDQSMKDFEIIIVDNGSKDDSVKVISECLKDVKLIRLDKNYGFSRAVNEGIRAASAPYVILLNNDTKARPDFAARLYDAIGRDDKIFSVSSKMLRMDKPDLIDNAGDLYCALGWAFARGKDKNEAFYNKPTEVFSALVLFPSWAAASRQKVI